MRNTDAILISCEIETVCLPNALVSLNEKETLLTTGININAMPKACLSSLQF